jgi:hypothetical protein
VSPLPAEATPAETALAVCGVEGAGHSAETAAAAGRQADGDFGERC